MKSEELTADQAETLGQLLESGHDVFYFDWRPLTQTSLVKHRIQTGDASLMHRRPYVTSERQVIRSEVDKMLSKGITEP